MLLWFRKTFEESVDLFQFTIGQPRSGDTDEFRAIGSAQDDFAEEDEHVYVVYDGATSFATEGRMRDELHYTQVGYDEMGREGTRRVAGIVRD